MFRRLLEPIAIIRLTLGAMYLYSGTDIVLHPTAWHWAVMQTPEFVINIVNKIGIDLFLTAQGWTEIFFGVVFILWFLPKALVRLSAFLSALQMAVILALVGIDGVTFRDIAVLGSALAIYRMKS